MDFGSISLAALRGINFAFTCLASFAGRCILLADCSAKQHCYFSSIWNSDLHALVQAQAASSSAFADPSAFRY